MKTEIFLITIFSCIFQNGCNADPVSDSVSFPRETVSTPAPVEKSKIEEIKICAETITTLSGGDFVFPRISPDGKKIAYSKVLVEDTEYGKQENTEVLLYDFQSRKTSVLLNSKQAKKYAVYASFVADFEWIGANRLRAYISDGDVDSIILTFDTQTRRVIKKEYSGAKDYDYERIYPREMEATFFLLVKNFPDIPKDVFRSAFGIQNAFKIANKGVVLQFWHTDFDSNIWYFDLETKKKHLLFETERIKNSDYGLKGAFEVHGKIFFIHKNLNGTEFFTFQDNKVSEIARTELSGEFVPLFSSNEKSIFLLKQPNFQSESKSSLWLFDGSKLKRITDVEELSDVAIDPYGKFIAFSFWANQNERSISVRNIK